MCWAPATAAPAAAASTWVIAADTLLATAAAAAAAAAITTAITTAESAPRTLVAQTTLARSWTYKDAEHHTARHRGRGTAVLHGTESFKASEAGRDSL